jgi:hypothetical protein
MCSGYTKKILLPEKGLSEEERKYLVMAQKISDVFSEEDNFHVVVQKIGELVTKNKIGQSLIRGNEHNVVVPITIETHAVYTSQGYLISKLSVNLLGYGTFIFHINGEKRILRLEVSLTQKQGEFLETHFHENGNLAGIIYKKDLLTKVKREAFWSEDGILQNERTIAKPERIKIVK